MRKWYQGGVYIIEQTGGATIKDMYGSADDQTLIDQSLATAPATLKIQLYEVGDYAKAATVSRAELRQVHMSYIDTAGADQLSEVYLLGGTATDEYRQREKIVWSDIDGVAEGVTSYLTSDVGVPTPVIMDISNKGQIYFITNWATIIDVDAATEHFFLRVVLTSD